MGDHGRALLQELPDGDVAYKIIIGLPDGAVFCAGYAGSLRDCKNFILFRDAMKDKRINYIAVFFSYIGITVIIIYLYFTK